MKSMKSMRRIAESLLLGAAVWALILSVAAACAPARTPAGAPATAADFDLVEIRMADGVRCFRSRYNAAGLSCIVVP